VGALLLLGLLAAPAAAAHQPGMALAAALTVTAMGGGLALAYAAPTLPPSFTIMAVATAEYAIAATASRAQRSRSPRRRAENGTLQ